MRLPRRLAPLVVAALACSLVVAQPAHGKGEVRATLEDSERVAGAAGGEHVTIAWSLSFAPRPWTLSSAPRPAVPDPRGRSAPEPFGASETYVRVAGAGGGAPRIFAATPPPGARGNPAGRYLAVVTAPAGGIDSLAIGLEGYRYVDGHSPVRADVLFPIVNDPFARGVAGTQAGNGTDLPRLPLVAVLAVATTLLIARHARRRTIGTTAIR